MGRPPKHHTNPVIRLRQALSIPGEEMTRELLSKRSGISPSTVRDIERGRFELTLDSAWKLAHATGVHPVSLILGKDPLLDWEGRPVDSSSKGRFEKLWGSGHMKRETHEKIFSCLMRAAENKGPASALLVSSSFVRWLRETWKAADLEKDVFDEFTKLGFPFSLSFAGLFYPTQTEEAILKRASQKRPRSKTQKAA
jgi:transcriptional regulator with XRE-family HTH domain